MPTRIFDNQGDADSDDCDDHVGINCADSRPDSIDDDDDCNVSDEGSVNEDCDGD